MHARFHAVLAAALIAATCAAQPCASWFGPLLRVPRHSHALAYDSRRGVTVLFGGTHDNTVENGDTWEWDGIQWALRAASGPSPRHSHAMAYDEARGVTVLFGGDPSGAGMSGETWEWDGQA